MIQIQIEQNVPMPPPREPRSPDACAFCNKRDRQGGYKTCDQCRENVKRQRQERIEQGICEYFSCPDKPKAGHTSCQVHLDKMLAYSMARRAERKRHKLCIDCGIRPQWWTEVCVICRPNRGSKSLLPGGARTAIKQYRRLEAIDARRAQAQDVLQFVTDGRAQQILVARHGLTDGVDRTLEEIGAELKVTRERVRQIEDSTLKEIAFSGVDVSLLRPPFRAIQRPPAKKRHYLVSDETRKKTAAHGLVLRALAAGKLKRRPCECCGHKKTIAHHPDYDKPLEVEWLCRPHHAQAHGRGDGEQKPKGRNWLDKIQPSQDHYDAKAIIAEIKDGLYKPKIKAIKEATGLNYAQVKAVLRGKRVRNEWLITMLRYVESLKAEKAA